MCPSGATYMSIRGLLFQWASAIKIKRSVLVLCKADIISFKNNLFYPWYSWAIAEWALHNNQSLTLTLYLNWVSEWVIVVKRQFSNCLGLSWRNQVGVQLLLCYIIFVSFSSNTNGATGAIYIFSSYLQGRYELNIPSRHHDLIVAEYMGHK
jgi:hypothetical protein